MKTFANLLKQALILAVVICCFSCSSFAGKPEKPFIIIEKSYGDLDGIKCWRYVYVGNNSVKRCFTEMTEKYNIGDTIK